MPRIFEEKGYRFDFYSADLGEPAHVHVRRGGKQAKFWVDPIGIARKGRFSEHELNEIERIINHRIGEILAAWRREQGKQ